MVTTAWLGNSHGRSPVLALEAIVGGDREDLAERYTWDVCEIIGVKVTATLFRRGVAAEVAGYRQVVARAVRQFA